MLTGKPASDFWREKFVFGQLERVFGDETGAKERAIAHCAAVLGVSRQMVYANFYFMAVPLEAFPPLARQYAAEKEEAGMDGFWERGDVEEVLERVRYRYRNYPFLPTLGWDVNCACLLFAGTKTSHWLRARSRSAPAW